MHVTSLHRYPVKSTAGESLAVARVERAGFAGDRRWMVIDAAGEKVSARTDRTLLLVRAELVPSGVVLHARGKASIAVENPVLRHEPPAGAATRDVTVWGHAAVGVDAGEEAATWLRELLGRDDVRLVSCPDPTRRALDPRYAEPGDHTAYADGFPVLLTTTASLDQVNEWVAAGAAERGEHAPAGPLPMVRFRPNVVVETLEPFVEEGWTRVSIGSVPFRVAGACGRCVLTTVDPETLEGGKEPLRSLARHHRDGSRTLFGVNLVPDGVGQIAVGDPVVGVGWVESADDAASVPVVQPQADSDQVADQTEPR